MISFSPDRAKGLTTANATRLRIPHDVGQAYFLAGQHMYGTRHNRNLIFLKNGGGSDKGGIGKILE